MAHVSPPTHHIERHVGQSSSLRRQRRERLGLVEGRVDRGLIPAPPLGHQLQLDQPVLLELLAWFLLLIVNVVLRVPSHRQPLAERWPREHEVLLLMGRVLT